jgi:proteasome assembly chaperone 3
MSHLTPKTLLGAGNSGRETMGQLLATQIASKIATRSLEETRTIMVGLGLEDISDSREAFFDLIDLVSKCI